MENLEKLQEKVDKMAYDISDIKVALKGYNGQEGLCKKVNQNSKSINKVYIYLAILAASTGGGAYGIIQTILNNHPF